VRRFQKCSALYHQKNRRHVSLRFVFLYNFYIFVEYLDFYVVFFLVKMMYCLIQNVKCDTVLCMLVSPTKLSRLEYLVTNIALLIVGSFHCDCCHKILTANRFASCFVVNVECQAHLLF
jgi:hypothetical protein